MILITGGFGFIGQGVARKLLRAGHHVALTRFRSTDLAWDLQPFLGGQLRAVDVDVREPWEVYRGLNELEITRVLHLATAGWSGSVSANFHTNISGLLNLLEAAHLLGVMRFVSASTIAVYGAAAGPYRERDQLSVDLPEGGPGALKRAEEIAAGVFASATDMDVRLARIGIVYGPGYRSMRNVVSRVCAAIAKGSDFDGPAFLPYSDYCHVDDIADGLVGMLTAERLSQTVYNLGQGEGVSKAQLVSAAAHHGLEPCGLDTLRHLPDWPLENFMDTRGAETDFGYTRSFHLTAGMADYIRALR